MSRTRAELEVEDLLKVVLVLVVVWLALEVLETFVDLALGVFAFLRPIIAVVVVVLIVLWLLDRI